MYIFCTVYVILVGWNHIVSRLRHK